MKTERPLEPGTICKCHYRGRGGNLYVILKHLYTRVPPEPGTKGHVYKIKPLNGSRSVHSHECFLSLEKEPEFYIDDIVVCTFGGNPRYTDKEGVVVGHSLNDKKENVFHVQFFGEKRKIAFSHVFLKLYDYGRTNPSISR